MKVTIPTPFEGHVHFRDGTMLGLVASFTSRHFGRAVVMPNLPAIHDAADAMAYRDRIRTAAGPGFEPLMTIKLRHVTTPAVIREARVAGVVAGKIYPEGATTASHDGIRDVQALTPVFRAMQDCEMVLCIHAEDPDVFVLDREVAYLPQVDWIIRHFPGLKVVVEHITTADAVEFVASRSVNVAATITAHHLRDTLDAIVGGLLNPHAFCKPIPKRPADRAALLRVALRDESGKFVYGGDSAPWFKGAKESACGCAGVFSAPTALAILTDVFARSACPPGVSPEEWMHDRDLEDVATRMGQFVSTAGPAFYGLPIPSSTITMVRKDWVVPTEIDGVVPYMAGATLGWMVEEAVDLSPANKAGLRLNVSPSGGGIAR